MIISQMELQSGRLSNLEKELDRLGGERNQLASTITQLEARTGAFE